MMPVCISISICSSAWQIQCTCTVVLEATGCIHTCHSSTACTAAHHALLLNLIQIDSAHIMFSCVLAMQKPYLLRGKTEQFFDPHYQLAVFGHNEDEYPFAVSLLFSCMCA